MRFVVALLLTVPLCAQVKITAQGKDKLSVEIDGKPFTDFYMGAQASKPYLHPLRTVDGKSVTRGFPMIADIPGEPHDHPHHKGLWFAHGDVNGYNFWAGDAEVPLDPKFTVLSTRPDVAPGLVNHFKTETPWGRHMSQICGEVSADVRARESPRD